MAQTTLSIRIDEGVKKQFEQLCNEFGLNLSSAITLFAKTVINERKIPFEIRAAKPSFVVDTKEELTAKLNAGYAEYLAGKGIPFEDAVAELDRKYGL